MATKKKPTDKELISKAMSLIAKKGHKKNPRPKKFYQKMVAARQDRKKMSE